ncbi:hypothetical protein L7F22_065204 [Adiantum nelumboides]|nr:hypothetical protein [Adiantum nelumboides]
MAALHHSTPHALVVPLPAQGHIHPILDLSLKLVSAGFMVTFANTRANHQRFIENGTTLKAAAEAGADLLRFVSLEEEFPAAHEKPMVEMFSPAMRGTVARLLGRLKKEEPPVSLLVFDFRMMFALDLAIAAGIPSLALWTQNAAQFTCNYLFSRNLLRLPSADDSTLFTCVQGVPPLKRTELTGLIIGNMPPPFPSDEYGSFPFRRAHELTWIVINTFEELEPTTLDTSKEILGFCPFALGPLINAPAFTISEGVTMTSVDSHFEWLQKHPKDTVLYIAFGTVVHLSETQLEELVLGLEASRQPFLWVFRPGFCNHSKKFTVESLSQRLNNQGLVVQWACQQNVLSHPAIGGFLTHCGWNSTIESITMGVPMLTWPLFADQYLNRRLVIEQWSVGLGFQTDDGNSGLVTRLEVEKKINVIMHGREGKELRQKARSLRSLAQSTYQGGGSSLKNFDLLKEKIWSFHMKD